jgi:hypothetical protein
LEGGGAPKKWREGQLDRKRAEVTDMKGKERGKFGIFQDSF